MRFGGRHELLRGQTVRLDQTVARDHQVNQADADASQIEKGLHGCRNWDTTEEGRLRCRARHVRRDAGPPASSLPGWHADVNLGRVWSHAAPRRIAV